MKLEYLKKFRFAFIVQFQAAKPHTRTTLYNRPETKQTSTRQQPQHKRHETFFKNATRRQALQVSCGRGSACKMKSCHKPQTASILVTKYHNNAQTPLYKTYTFLKKIYLNYFLF